MMAASARANVGAEARANRDGRITQIPMAMALSHGAARTEWRLVAGFSWPNCCSLDGAAIRESRQRRV